MAHIHHFSRSPRFPASIFRRGCVDCPETTPQCPDCPKGKVCTLQAQTCSSCPKAVCVPDGSSSGPNVGAIAGGVIGGVVGVVLIALLLWFLHRRRHPNSDDESLEKNTARTHRSRAASIASTVYTRASNVIQIGYVPNRSSPDNQLAPPVPPIPAAHRQTERFFMPGDIRDSVLSDISEETQSRHSLSPSLYQSVEEGAVVSPQPVQQALRGKAAMVSVKSAPSSGLAREWNPDSSSSVSSGPSTSSLSSFKKKGPSKSQPPMSGSIVARSVTAKPINIGHSGKPSTIIEEEDSSPSASPSQQAHPQAPQQQQQHQQPPPSRSPSEPPRQSVSQHLHPRQSTQPSHHERAELPGSHTFPQELPGSSPQAVSTPSSASTTSPFDDANEISDPSPSETGK